MPSETLSLTTDERLQILDITDRVRSAVPDDADGTVAVFTQHTTTGLTVNEAESRLVDDMEEFFARLVVDEGWAHDEIDDNADSHLRASLLGPSETIPVVGGTLQLGTWQSVLLVECDGPRQRTVVVSY